MALSPDDLEKLRREYEEILETQKKIESGLGSYLSHVKKLGEGLSLVKKINDLISGQQTKIAQLQGNLTNLSGQQLIDAQEKLKKEQDSLELLEYQKEELEGINERLKTSINNSNALTATYRSFGKAIVFSGKKLFEQSKYFFEQDKATRQAALNMGLVSSQSAVFAKNIFKASINTNILGADAKELAGIQAGYSEQIGRAVQLTNSGLEAMAELAHGTVLGADGATEMVSVMDNFGISTERARNLIEETVDSSHKMGINAAKVTRNIQRNIKLAQGYVFKGGIKGVTEMAKQAARFRFDMESTAAVADKLINIEGAVEMASRLQVLGGEWAKLADPFRLMFMARNDMEGLQKAIIDATKSTAQFNARTGEFDISALEMHRLREVANSLGLDYKELAETAKETAKALEIKSRIIGIVDPEIRDFVAATAQFDEKTKRFFINVGGEKKFVNQLNKIGQTALKAEMNQKETLKQRAIEAQSLDELIGNLTNTLKSLILPFFSGIERGLRKPLNNFIEWMQKNKIGEKLAAFGESIGKKLGWFIENFGKLIAEFPRTSLALIGGLTLAIKGMQWFGYGIMLGKGFLAVTKGGNLFGSLGKMAGTKAMSTGGKLFKHGKFLKGAKVAASGAAKTGIAGTVISGGVNLLDYLSGEIGGGEALGRTLITGALTTLGASLGAISGLGAASVPLGLAGAAGGGVAAEYFNDLLFGEQGKKQQDFILRPNHKPIPFSGEDTLVGFKPGGPIDRISNRGELENLNISFDTIKVEFSPILLRSDGKTFNLNLDREPELVREISRKVQEELRKAIGGGKLNPNPIF